MAPYPNMNNIVEPLALGGLHWILEPTTKICLATLLPNYVKLKIVFEPMISKYIHLTSNAGFLQTLSFGVLADFVIVTN